jgi:hypothetical protein
VIWNPWKRLRDLTEQHRRLTQDYNRVLRDWTRKTPAGAPPPGFSSMRPPPKSRTYIGRVTIDRDFTDGIWEGGSGPRGDDAVQIRRLHVVQLPAPEPPWLHIGAAACSLDLGYHADAADRTRPLAFVPAGERPIFRLSWWGSDFRPLIIVVDATIFRWRLP